MANRQDGSMSDDQNASPRGEGAGSTAVFGVEVEGGAVGGGRFGGSHERWAGQEKAMTS
jgi:hypothetical protein